MWSSSLESCLARPDPSLPCRHPPTPQVCLFRVAFHTSRVAACYLRARASFSLSQSLTSFTVSTYIKFFLSIFVCRNYYRPKLQLIYCYLVRGGLLLIPRSDDGQPTTPSKRWVRHGVTFHFFIGLNSVDFLSNIKYCIILTPILLGSIYKDVVVTLVRFIQVFEKTRPH